MKRITTLSKALLAGQDILSEARAWQEKRQDIRGRVTAELDKVRARASQLTELLAELDGGAPAQKTSGTPTGPGGSKRRAAGGSVGPVKGGSRWRYQIRLDGKYYSKAFATRGEAEDALEGFKMRLTPDPVRLGDLPVLHQSKFDRMPQEEPTEELLQDLRDPDRRPPPPPVPVEQSVVGYIHPGAGWGPVKAGGLVTHLNCKGTGKVPEPGNVRGKTMCRPCSGEGFRRCLPVGAHA
jgi:hypothetical protein